MKKQLLSLCTAGLLVTTFLTPASAASLNAIRPKIINTAVSAVSVPIVYPPDAEGTVSFQNLESRLRKQNLSIISLQNTLDIQKKFDRKATYDSLVDTINKMVEGSWEQSQKGKDTTGLNADIEAMRAQLETLKEDDYQDTLDSLTHLLENSIQKVIQGAQSLYLTIVSYEVSLEDLNRKIASLDRNVNELELRVSLGQVSELTLTQLKATQQSLKSQKSSMELGLEKMRASLALLLGEPTTKTLKLAALPTGWRTTTLPNKSYETALKEVKGKSYTVYSTEKSKKDAKKDWDDEQDKLVSGTFSYKKAEQTYKSALNTYEDNMKNFAITFKELYQAVPDTQQALKAAEAALAYQEKLYSAAELKYQQGQISQKQLTDVKDELLSARSATTTAEIKAFTAYHQYQTAFIPDAL